MANLSSNIITPSGLNPTFVAASAGGDTFDNDGRTYLHVKNGGASSINVTIDSVVLCNQGFDHNLVVAVPAGGERIMGPFDPSRFNDPTTSKVNVTYSAVTSVTVSVMKI